MRRRTALRVKRRITREGGAEMRGEIYEIGARVNPILEVRKRDESRRRDIRVRSFDDHVACRIHVNARRILRVRFEEPDHDGDVVADALERHRDCTVGLEENHGSAIVVCKRCRFGVEGSVGRD